MIGHCLDPHADHEPSYDAAQSIDDLVDIVGQAPRRKDVSWSEAIEIAGAAHRGERSPVERYPRLAAIAEARNRVADPQLIAALRRVEEGRA